MTKIFRITIPAKPHIRKYIHIMYGYPLVLDKNHTMGSIIISLLQKKSLSTGYDYRQRVNRYRRLTANIECHLSAYRFEDSGMSISPVHVLAINQILENQFNDNLYQWVLNKTTPNVRYKGTNKSIRSFMEHYCLEEDVDITFEALQKAEQRRRLQVDENRKKTLAQFCP